MIALLDNNHDLEECAADLGRDVGLLVTPQQRRRVVDDGRLFAVDNGCFNPAWEPASFLSLLNRLTPYRERCKFVSVPDVVGSARRTLEVFDRWKDRLEGWKLALVCQDGQQDLPIPWDEIGAVFIGGSTAWKCSLHAQQIVQAARALGKWTHVGRVNTPVRWMHFEEMGVDSADGSGIARYSHMRRAIGEPRQQPFLIPPAAE